MEYGFTTGSCSAASAKAATYMLLSGRRKEKISIETPKGITFNADIVDIEMGADYVYCGVIKDGKDDPDVTTGAHICTKVVIHHSEDISSDVTVNIHGGMGVGVVTKPGLDQKVGKAAINRVPRQMIEKEVLEVACLFDFHGIIDVFVIVPDGEVIAQKTFNPRLGIEGGISILGTSGIVEPMSKKALIDTIRVECNQKKSLGYNILPVSPGNYGLDFMKREYHYDLDKSVKCSNFIGETLDIARELGFEAMLLTGHIGKLIKLTGGIMNTHSKEADCRMELLSIAAFKSNASREVMEGILDAVTTEEGIRIIKNEGILENTIEYLIEKIMYYVNKRAGDTLKVEVIMYSNEFGFLGKSKGADAYINKLLKSEY